MWRLAFPAFCLYSGGERGEGGRWLPIETHVAYITRVAFFRGLFFLSFLSVSCFVETSGVYLIEEGMGRGSIIR